MKVFFPILLYVLALADACLRAADHPLETVFSESKYQITGVAITADSRLFVCYPYWLDAHKYSMVEVGKDGSVCPYPDAAWNSFKKGENGQNKFVCVQAVYADDSDRLWVVDPAGIGLGDVYEHADEVVAIDLKTDKVLRVYRFPESVAGPKSYINDIRVDAKRGFAYLTSSSNGGIVVLNIRDGSSRFVLHGTSFVTSDPNYSFHPGGGGELMSNGKPVKGCSDGIALSHDGQWLYFKPLTDDKLYRVDTSVLRDFSTTEKQVEGAVRDLGHFVTTGGMEMDRDGNLYLGDMERDSIVKLSPELHLITLVQDREKLIWPDSYSIANGYLYISCSQVHLMPWFNQGKNLTHLPYRVYRLKIEE